MNRTPNLTHDALRKISTATATAGALLMVKGFGVAIGSAEHFERLHIPGWYVHAFHTQVCMADAALRIVNIQGVHGLGYRPMLAIVLPSATELPQAWWKASVIDLRDTREQWVQELELKGAKL